MFLPLNHITFEHQYNGTDWQDFTGSVVEASIILREFSGKHTLTLSLFDPVLDPSQGTTTNVLKEGDKLRVYAHNPAGVSRKMATFKIRKLPIEIDNSKPPGRRNKVTITAYGTGITGVGGAGASTGVASIDELSNVITAAPFEIGGDGFGTGITAPTGTFTEVASIDEASELDQLLLTRDSNPGVVMFEDPEGAIQIFDPALSRTGAATWTIGPANYSRIDERFDSSHVINVVTIRYVEKIKTGNKATRKRIHDHTFTDDASIAKYGRRKKKLTVHKQENFAAHANRIFARNADPVPVPTSVTIPVREVSELLPGYADGAYVGNKVTVVGPDGVATYACRVARIEHAITARKWLVKVYLRHQDVIEPPVRPAAAVDTEIGNNPDGTILTDHLDTAVVTGDKLADEVDGTGKTITGAIVTTGGVPGVSMHVVPSPSLVFATGGQTDGSIFATTDDISAQLELSSPTTDVGVAPADLYLVSGTPTSPTSPFITTSPNTDLIVNGVVNAEQLALLHNSSVINAVRFGLKTMATDSNGVGSFNHQLGGDPQFIALQSQNRNRLYAVASHDGTTIGVRATNADNDTPIASTTVTFFYLAIR